ncbi:MAG: lipid-A-disaccharide synthase N-terminal domain-containing protein [Desulfobacteraceae bacterium]|jgi:lipid-A-disaccharide synthase-like uncharacterized protein
MDEKCTLWLIVGFIGQLFFTMRFILQWIATERAKESIIPLEFWYLSIIGSLLLLSYALFRRDPVFILGQLFGIIVYSRNIYFISQRKKK